MDSMWMKCACYEDVDDMWIFLCGCFMDTLWMLCESYMDAMWALCRSYVAAMCDTYSESVPSHVLPPSTQPRCDSVPVPAPEPSRYAAVPPTVRAAP